MKFKILMLALMGWAGCFTAQAQSLAYLVDGEGKTLKVFLPGQEIFLFQTDRSLEGDTLASLNFSGILREVGPDALVLTDYKLTEKFYVGDALLPFHQETFVYGPDMTRRVPIESIGAIGLPSRGAKVGQTMKMLGAAAFVLAPLVSLNLNDLDEFNTQTYINWASFGALVGLSGLGLEMFAKNKLYVLREGHYTPDAEVPFKQLEGTLEIR